MVNLGWGWSLAGGVNERIVDENVELSARQLGDFVVAGLDAVLFGDIQGKGGHANGGHLGEHSGVAGRRDDVYPWSMSARLFRMLVSLRV